MRSTPRVLSALDGRFTVMKAPRIDAPAAQQAPEVAATVTRMLRDIEDHGLEAVLRYAGELDGWHGGDVELDAATVASSGDRLAPDLRQAVELGADRTRGFAVATRSHLVDFRPNRYRGW